MKYACNNPIHHFSFPLPIVFYSNVQGDSHTSICITIEPGLLLKGDILVRSIILTQYNVNNIDSTIVKKNIDSEMIIDEQEFIKCIFHIVFLPHIFCVPPIFHILHPEAQMLSQASSKPQ